MTTFLVIGLVGLALLAVSFLLGDLLDGVFDGLFDGLGGDVFSTAVIGAFVAAFGFGGAIAEGAGAPMLVIVPTGIASGVVFGSFAAWLTRLVRGSGSKPPPSTHDALGHSGRVLSDIPDDGFGVIRIVIGGHTMQLNARAERPLASGVEVHVTSVLSPTAVTVAPVWDTDGPPSLA